MTDMSHPIPTMDYEEEGLTRTEARANHRQHILEAAQAVIDSTGDLVAAHVEMIDQLKITDNNAVTKALETLHIAITGTLDAMEAQLNEDLRKEQLAAAPE